MNSIAFPYRRFTYAEFSPHLPQVPHQVLVAAPRRESPADLVAIVLIEIK